MDTILAVLLVISVFRLLPVSSNTWRAFQETVSIDTITVVNVFPHDPQAFTQVNFIFFFQFLHIMYLTFFNSSSVVKKKRF